MTGVACLLVGALLILGGSVVFLSDSFKRERENEVEIYLKAEKDWDEIYLPQFQNLEIQAIKNYSLYKQNLNEITLKEHDLATLNQ